MKAYLALYNLASFLAWAAILYTTATDCGPTGLYATQWYYDYPHKLLVRVQLANAIFEFSHAVVGLVPLPLSALALQFFARLIITLGVLWFVPESPGNFSKTAYVGLSVAWGVTELIRYSFYFFKQVGAVPKFLVWLRYLAFIVLYPLGLMCEPVVVWKTAWHVLGFYHWFLLAGLAMYIPGFVRLYGYMWRQRRRYLSV